MASFLNNVTVKSDLGKSRELKGPVDKLGSDQKIGSSKLGVKNTEKQDLINKGNDTSQKEKEIKSKQSQENMSSIDNEKFELLLSRLNTVQPDNVRQSDLKIFNFVKQNWDNFTREQKDKLHQNRIALAFIFNPQKELKIQHEENQDIIARDIQKKETNLADSGILDGNENIIKGENGHLLFLKDLVESLDQITADEISGEKPGNYNFPNEKVYVFDNKDEDFYYCLYPSFAYSDKQL